MKVIKSPQEMKNLSLTIQRGGQTLALIPTMGALHMGHISLIDRAHDLADVSVMSIFVNPTQFSPNEDLGKYPRPFERDCALAEAAGCDYIFAPAVQDMYPLHYSTFVNVEGVTERLCGESRPGHFKGVATVVLKLLNIVNPLVAVFGQKDAQQVIVIKRMIKDLDISVKIDVVPTYRENDGLALSSRNVYLTKEERKQAPLINKGLSEANRLFSGGQKSALVLKKAILDIYTQAEIISPEYVEIVDTTTVQPLAEITGEALIAVACRTRESGTRLIDNIIVGGSV